MSWEYTWDADPAARRARRPDGGGDQSMSRQQASREGL
jgi:hypothetical protein